MEKITLTRNELTDKLNITVERSEGHSSTIELSEEYCNKEFLYGNEDGVEITLIPDYSKHSTEVNDNLTELTNIIFCELNLKPKGLYMDTSVRHGSAEITANIGSKWMIDVCKYIGKERIFYSFSNNGKVVNIGDLTKEEFLAFAKGFISALNLNN